MSFIYLDHNATTPVAASARAEALRFLDVEYGNPSSSHGKGRAAKCAVDTARQSVATLLHADPGEIVFTGSATEANNLALLGAAAAMPRDKRHLILSAIEHPAVMEPALMLQRQGWELSWVRVDRHGVVDVQELEAMLRPETAIVSVMHANNELGTLQPLQHIAPLVRRVGALMHVDAAQSIGKLPVDVDTLGADLLTLAGHKMYAPKGIGALYVRAGTAMQSLMHGAGQEHGLRPGTENVPYIAALGAAALEVDRLMPQKGLQMAQLRDVLQEHLTAAIDGLLVNGHPERRLPNTLHVSLPRGNARELVLRLAESVGLSAGAACHSGDGAQAVSGVMRAIGATQQQARGALRISLGYGTTAEEVEQAASRITTEYRSMR